MQTSKKCRHVSIIVSRISIFLFVFRAFKKQVKLRIAIKILPIAQNL